MKPSTKSTAAAAAIVFASTFASAFTETNAQSPSASSSSASSTTTSPTTPTHSMMGRPAPSFDLPTLDGGRVSLADQRGKLVVLHFGAGW